VIGLDAEGTRDLVTHSQTGLLLPYPAGYTSWPSALKNTSSPTFKTSATAYAALLSQVTLDHALRESMGKKGSTEGIEGFTWWDAMERCVDGYRESMRISRKAAVKVGATASGGDAGASGGGVEGNKVGRVSRVLSRGLAHRDSKRPDLRETIWHLSELAVLSAIPCPGAFRAALLPSHSAHPGSEETEEFALGCRWYWNKG